MLFGNALLISLVTILLASNKYLKWLIIAYPIFELFVIVVTGNHYFLDAILGF